MITMIVLAVTTGQVMMTTTVPTQRDCDQEATIWLDHYKREGIDVTVQCIVTHR